MLVYKLLNLFVFLYPTPGPFLKITYFIVV
jgi:hypothetical protein